MISPRIAIALMLLSACSASLDLPDTALVTCSANNDCTNGRVCLGVTGQCVKAGDACVTVDNDNAIADADGNPCTQRNGVSGICVSGGCVAAVCGDGLTTPPETCDNGIAANSDAPGACRRDCALPFCGDDILDPDEDCEPGDVIGSNARDICNPQCRYDSCGDGHLGPNEDCDDGNDADNDGCVACRAASCGDGSVWAGVEACDDGNDVDEDGCRQCRLASCGNGALDASEVCDDGNLVDTDDCLSTCLAPSCGDGFVRAGIEECDLGSLNGQTGQACTPACRNDVCGDGHRGPAEPCDDGERNGGVLSQCSVACKPAGCGDGRIGPYEQCDDGANNGAASSACRTDCQRNYCGDARVGRGEQCDLASENGLVGSPCTSTCQTNVCGDRHSGPGEECDAGTATGAPGSACTPTCQDNVCGDGHRGPGEQCDNGAANGTVSSRCRPNCTVIICGDGAVDRPAEECDAGAGQNGNGTSRCSRTCCLDIDNDTVCDSDSADLCFGNDATGDDDGDGVCNEVDRCMGGDDGVDSDGDLTPDACDIAPSDDAVSAYAQVGDVIRSRRDSCDNSDRNGDGLNPRGLNTQFRTYALSESIVPMWRGSHSYPDFFNGSVRGCTTTCVANTANNGSPFGVYDIATVDGLTYMAFDQSDIALLPAGTYVLRVRLRNSATASAWRVTVATRPGRSCLAASAVLNWTAASQQLNAFNESPSLQFTVAADQTSNRTQVGCPIAVNMFNDSFAYDKGGIAFDYVRINKTCATATECDDGDASTIDTCSSGVCEYGCF